MCRARHLAMVADSRKDTPDIPCVPCARARHATPSIPTSGNKVICVRVLIRMISLVHHIRDTIASPRYLLTYSDSSASEDPCPAPLTSWSPGQYKTGIVSDTLASICRAAVTCGKPNGISVKKTHVRAGGLRSRCSWRCRRLTNLLGGRHLKQIFSQVV